jgi:hypothetical protein
MVSVQSFGFVACRPITRQKYDGGKGVAKQSELTLAGLLLPLLFHPDPQPVKQCHSYSWWSSSLNGYPTCQSSLEPPLQTHPEVSFTNLLGISKSSHD